MGAASSKGSFYQGILSRLAANLLARRAIIGLPEIPQGPALSIVSSGAFDGNQTPTRETDSGAVACVSPFFHWEPLLATSRILHRDIVCREESPHPIMADGTHSPNIISARLGG
jgi:hypothetical protein